MTKTRKKLIEVALPLEAINIASAREKSIRHGHPSTLHLWWARRPLAAARAVIFSQMVDDPSTYVDTLKQDPKLKRKAEGLLKAKVKLWEEAVALHKKLAGSGVDAPEPGQKPTLDEVLADVERQKLFGIIEDLVLWTNINEEKALRPARDAILQSWRRTCLDNVDHPRAKELFNRHVLPAFHDPFAGGGALPLEAQRLGLESHASDLNPVAVLINKATIEIPSKFAGRPPVNPAARKNLGHSGSWQGARGLAEDVRYYGQWMRDEAEKRIGHLYPAVEVTQEMVKDRPDLKPYLGQKLTVIAWLWARTVKSPNPAFAQVDVPLASTFLLSTKAGKEAYVEPIVDGASYRFTVKVGKPKNIQGTKNGTKLARGANFQCLMSGTPIDGSYVKAEGLAQRLGERMMAIVVDGIRGRLYLPPSVEQEEIARAAKPSWQPTLEMAFDPKNIWTPNYGLKSYGDLFTSRQLVALTTFSDLVSEAIVRAEKDAVNAGIVDDGKKLNGGGNGARAYAEGLGVYLGISVDKMTDRNSSICGWDSSRDSIRGVFGRQAIPMMWDFAESNSVGTSAGSFVNAVDQACRVLDQFSPKTTGVSQQADAATQNISSEKLISTDPPYYDNIGYADLSDFFYVWLRRSLQPVYPTLFSTLAVPKAQELVATPYRHGSKEKAEAFFLDGMTLAMRRLAEQAHPAFPVTIYYAFKQSESKSDEGVSSTGWDTFLAAVIDAGFAISGTWPMRTELANKLIGINSNMLASSIVLVCRKRAITATTISRRGFIAELKSELPQALAHLQRGNIAPVDLAQASIGPGMAVYTRYAKVLDAAGKALSVREALALINQTLDEALAEQEGDFDPDSRWALTWFDQQGFAEGPAGEAILLATARATALNGLEQAGIIESGRGHVRLLRPEELPMNWDPTTDKRLTVWEMVHQLVRTMNNGGERDAAQLVVKLGTKAEVARELAYRLYNICERKKRNQEALWYNSLVQAWPELLLLAQDLRKNLSKQADMFEQDSE